MKKVKLFEIPIYLMEEKEYEKRCMNYTKKQASKTTPDNYHSFFEHLKKCYYIQRPWLYNQIIGFIVISHYQNSIWFDEYATLDKRIRTISGKKHYIKNMMLRGYHFHVSSTMNNKEIKNNIIQKINGIKKNILKRQWYLDLDIFNKQLKFIDLREMIDEEGD